VEVLYAIIKTGGKQYRVKEGDLLKIEKLPETKGENVVFDQVLAIVDEDNSKFGHPFIDDAKVNAKVIEQGKNKKVLVFKYKPKRRYRKKYGHRQPYTKVLIENIENN